MTLDSNLESNSSQIAPAKAIVSEEIQKLEPSALIELFELTYTAAVNGIDQVVRYHAGTNEVKSDIDGSVYKKSNFGIYFSKKMVLFIIYKYH